MSKILYFFLLNFLLIPYSYSACTWVNSKPVTSMNVLGGGSVTISNDMEDGTQLYVLRNFYSYGNVFDEVNCTSAGKIVANWFFSQTPYPLSSYGNGAYAGKVYETGLPGVGVYVDPGMGRNFSNGFVPAEVPAYAVANTEGICVSGTSCYVIGQQKMSDLYLIKTGTISPGIIRGENLPCIKMNYTLTGEKPDDSKNLVINSCFTGVINVVVPTCQTPTNVDVELGRFDVNIFKGKGDVTPWVNSSIQLTGCPVFHGYHDRQYYFWDGSAENSSYGNIENIIELNLMPSEHVISSNEGIMALRTNNSMAKGIGIQMAHGDESSQQYVSYNTIKQYVQPKGTSGTITIPLVARYIQTEENVSPGIADGVVTYTINYR